EAWRDRSGLRAGSRPLVEVSGDVDYEVSARRRDEAKSPGFGPFVTNEETARVGEEVAWRSAPRARAVDGLEAFRVDGSAESALQQVVAELPVGLVTVLDSLQSRPVVAARRVVDVDLCVAEIVGVDAADDDEV